MEKKVILPISGQEVTMVSPKAGDRNSVVMELRKEFPDAEATDDLVMVKLLPYAIKEHPWNLDGEMHALLARLEIQDYDYLMVELASMIKPSDKMLKKLEEVSGKSLTKT